MIIWVTFLRPTHSTISLNTWNKLVTSFKYLKYWISQMFFLRDSKQVNECFLLITCSTITYYYISYICQIFIIRVSHVTELLFWHSLICQSTSNGKLDPYIYRTNCSYSINIDTKNKEFTTLAKYMHIKEFSTTIFVL